MNPLELLNNIDNIKYGFIDKYGVVHKNAKKDFFLFNYHIESDEVIKKELIGTCIESVELIRSFFKSYNLDIDSYIIYYDNEEKIASHTIAVLEFNNKFYYLEKSLVNIEPSIYNSLNEILNKLIKEYPRMYKIKDLDKNKIHVYKYYKPKYNLTYKEFIDYVKTCEEIDWRSKCQK